MPLGKWLDTKWSMRKLTDASQRGCSSVVERDLAKVEVEGSNPFTRLSSPEEEDAPKAPQVDHPGGSVQNLTQQKRPNLTTLPNSL
jgi:hypothetical protein